MIRMTTSPTPIPSTLTHYYDATRGPLRSLTALPPDEGETIQAQLRASGLGFASQRDADYLVIRRELEARIRALFVSRGGLPQRATPHYFIVGTCDWVLSWYAEGRALSLPIIDFDTATVSLTYGDSFPAMRYHVPQPWRGQVYTLAELPDLVLRFGLPQITNPDGARGPERYIEAQVWSDAPLRARGLLA
jgi:hypothetical protein